MILKGSAMSGENDIIVGLAGHIDHGKTSLVRALNGFDGDDTAQEKERGITLDLSFSHLNLPNRNVAFIDVPGHEKLVKNMIAGSFGIDVLCLVVASDDGLMPQSFEHLAIADILGVQSCICVLSKVDKVSQETLHARKCEIQSAFKDLQIALLGIYEFSALSADSYTQQITQALDLVPKPPNREFGMLMYYIDRAFSLSGSGCVVTGTLLGSQITQGQKVFVCELDKEVAIRQIQIHDTPSDTATPSHRVALNLSGISANELSRGMLITQKGFMRGSNFIDVYLHTQQPLKNNTICQLYLGTKRMNVRVNILNENASFACICAEESIYCVFGQPFVLRNGNVLLGGGRVLNPISDPMRKKDKIPLLHKLLDKDFPNAFKILSKIHRHGFGLVCATQRFGLSHSQAISIASNITDVFFDPKDLVLYPLSELENLKTQILDIFLKNKNALVSANSLQIKFRWASVSFLQNALDSLYTQHFIRKQDSLYLAKNNQIQNIDEYLCEKIYSIYENQKFSPIAPYNLYDELDIDRSLGDRALKNLCLAKKIVRLNHNLFITTAALSDLNVLMRKIIKQHGYIDITLFKTYLPLSRKYLISYLEYLDNFQDIYQEEHKRKLKFT